MDIPKYPSIRFTMKLFVTFTLLLAGALAKELPDDSTWNQDLQNPYNYMVEGNLPGDSSAQAGDDEDQVKSLFKGALRKAKLAKQGLIEADEEFQIVSKLSEAKNDKQKALDMSKDAQASYQQGMQLLAQAKKLDSTKDYLDDDHLGLQVKNLLNADGDESSVTDSAESESKNLVQEEKSLAETPETRGYAKGSASALKDFLS